MARAFTTTLACAELSLAALVASAARADEDSTHQPATAQPSSTGLLVRPIVGLGLGLSDSGLHVGAHLGLRVSPVQISLSLQTNGWLVDLVKTQPSGRYFDLLAAHADWVFVISEHLAAFAGLGYGSLRYGYLFDSPLHSTGALLPEAGLTLGHRRTVGRLILNVALVVPMTSPSERYFSPADRIAPPQFMVSLVFSI